MDPEPVLTSRRKKNHKHRRNGPCRRPPARPPTMVDLPTPEKKPRRAALAPAAAPALAALAPPAAAIPPPALAAPAPPAAAIPPPALPMQPAEFDGMEITRGPKAASK